MIPSKDFSGPRESIRPKPPYLTLGSYSIFADPTPFRHAIGIKKAADANLSTTIDAAAAR